MIWIAWKMLTCNTGKYIGIISGITFSALLIAQQSAIFWGLMLLTTSHVRRWLINRHTAGTGHVYQGPPRHRLRSPTRPSVASRRTQHKCEARRFIESAEDSILRAH